MVFNEEGIDPLGVINTISSGDSFQQPEFIKKMRQLNLRNSIFIDITASGIVAGAYEEILKDTISIVTPNKIAASRSFAHYQLLKSTANKFKSQFLFETNVGAGLPVLSTLSDLVKNRITIPMNIKGLKYNKDKNDELLPVFSGADDKIRYANSGELDIMGKYVPGYEPENKLFLGGEGMIATADGYTDFIRMLLNHGELNGYRFLNESTVKEMYSPHTQLENEYGYNGYNLWVTSELVKEKGEGDEGLWRGRRETPPFTLAPAGPDGMARAGPEDLWRTKGFFV